MLGTLFEVISSAAPRILLIWFSANTPRTSIKLPIKAKPRNARGAIFIFRKDMVFTEKSASVRG